MANNEQHEANSRKKRTKQIKANKGKTKIYIFIYIEEKINK